MRALMAHAVKQTQHGQSARIAFCANAPTATETAKGGGLHVQQR